MDTTTIFSIEEATAFYAATGDTDELLSNGYYVCQTCEVVFDGDYGDYDDVPEDCDSCWEDAHPMRRW